MEQDSTEGAGGLQGFELYSDGGSQLMSTPDGGGAWEQDGRVEEALVPELLVPAEPPEELSTPGETPRNLNP